MRKRCLTFAGRVSFAALLFLVSSFGSGFSEDVPDLSSHFLPPGSILPPGQWRYDQSVGRDIVATEYKTLQTLSSYRCLVRTFYHEKKDDRGRLKSDEKMVLSVHSSNIRVDLLRPRKGAWLIYRKDTNQVRVKPFSFLPMTLALNPDSSLITSRFGHTINHADYGSFYSRVLAPACLLSGCVYLDRGVVLGREVRVINVAPVFGIARPIFGRMWVSFDKKTHLPVSISSVDAHGRFMERITYTHCQLNPSFPLKFFRE